MIDVYETSDRRLTRFAWGFGANSAERPGTLSPDPWHFALFASSMIQKQGDAAAMPTSPMPLDCCGARGACQQSPTLHSSAFRLSRTPAISKGQQTERLFYHAIGRKRKMPGVWGQSPQESANRQGDPGSRCLCKDDMRELVR